MDKTKKGVDPDYIHGKEEKQRMKLPVYHAPKEDGTVTIKLCIKPRLVERTFFIIVILVLVSTMLIKPDFLFRPECPVAEMTEIATEQPAAVQQEPLPPVQAEPAALEPAEEPAAPPAANDTQEAPPENEEAIPATTQTEIDNSRLTLQITGYTVEQKSPTWYKLKGLDVKVTNDNEITFYPTVKVWYYDDGTDDYFSPNSPEKDKQSFSIGIGPKSSRTFTLSGLDESFSGEDVHPTVLVKLYDLDTGDYIKEITAVVDFQ